MSSRSRTRERITWRVTPAGRATRPHVLARSVYQGATGDRRMLVFAGLPAARQRDRGGGEGWPREREMERREGQEAAIGRISTRRDEDEGCASLARATKEKDETGKISPCVERTRRGEKRDRGEGRIYRLVGGTERDGGGVEGLERVWGLTGTRGRKHRGEGGKNEVTVERDTREHRGGWKRGSARRGKSCGWRSGNRGRRDPSRPTKPRLVPTTTVLAVATAQRPPRISVLLHPAALHFPSPSSPSSPLERATCPTDQRTPPPTIDPKSVGTSVRLADITRLMLARTRAEDDPRRALYTRGEVGRLDGLG